jgi:UTP--glucose-1-phosphate uridylyltransferase
MGKIRKAVFPVAGLGTRFLPATKVIPKEMLTVVDKPVIQYAVEEARAAGIDQFIFVTGRGKTAMVDHFDISFELQQTLLNRGKTEELETIQGILAKPGQIAVVRQQVPLGLGHAVLCAKELVGNEPFVVILPDDLVLGKQPCLKQMVQAWEEVGGAVVAVADVPRADTNKYGVLDVTHDDGRLVTAKGMVEKPSPEDAPSTVSIIGRYILPPQIFRHLENTKQGAGGEIQLTDALRSLISEQPFHGLRFEGKRYDCGNKLGFLEANIAFALAREDTSEEVRKMLSEMLKSVI